MELKVGDRVRTASGREGKITLLNRMSAFVELDDNPPGHTPSYLLSELTKIDPPKLGDGSDTENKSP